MHADFQGVSMGLLCATCFQISWSCRILAALSATGIGRVCVRADPTRARSSSCLQPVLKMAYVAGLLAFAGMVVPALGGVRR